jgi:hypothetical protein
VQGALPSNEALQLSADDGPVDAGQQYQVRMPRVDRQLLFVAVLVFVAALGWVGTTATLGVEMATDLDQTIPTVLAVFAGTATSVSVQVAIDFLRRRRQWAHTASLRDTACACHAETLGAIAALAQRVEEIGTKATAEGWAAYAAGVQDGMQGSGGDVIEMARRGGVVPR